jgi:hypothetical protein
MFVRALTGIAAGGSGGAGAGGRNAHGADAGQASGAAAGGGSGGGGGSASASASASGGGGGGGGQRKSVFERLSAGYARLGSGGGSAMDVDQQQQPRSINPAVQRALLGATGTPAAAAAGSKRKASDSHAGGDAAAAAAAEAASAALRGAAITSNGGAAAAAPAAGVAPQQQAAKKVRPAAGTPAAAAGAAAAPGGASSKAAELAALRQMLAAKEAEVRRLQREQADAAADERSVVVFGVARAVTDDVLRAHFSVCGGDAGDAVRRATLLPGRHVPGAPGAYIEFRDSHDAGGGVVPVSRAVLGALGLSGSTLLGHQITVRRREVAWLCRRVPERKFFSPVARAPAHPPPCTHMHDHRRHPPNRWPRSWTGWPGRPRDAPPSMHSSPWHHTRQQAQLLWAATGRGSNPASRRARRRGPAGPRAARRRQRSTQAAQAQSPRPEEGAECVLEPLLVVSKRAGTPRVSLCGHCWWLAVGGWRLRSTE